MSKDRISKLRKAKRKAEAKRMKSMFKALPSNGRMYRFNPGLSKWEISKWHNHHTLAGSTVSRWSSIAGGTYKLSAGKSSPLITCNRAVRMLLLLSVVIWQVFIPIYLIYNS